METEEHKFIGMHRDNHPINLKPEFLWEAHNIRITNREDDTLFSITNEKGTKDTNIDFDGIYLGHCVLNEFLVVFTVSNNTSYIYRIQEVDGELTKIILYSGEGLLDEDYPVKCLGFYEADILLKVYWVDGKHLPRLINITQLELELLQYTPNKDYTTDFQYTNNSFNFCPDLKLQEEIKVTKIFGLGAFMPGTILYAFSYYKKYGLESKIFYITPIYYTSLNDRAEQADKLVPNTFSIEVSNLDDFDYLRIYSILKNSESNSHKVLILNDVYLKDKDGNLLDSVSVCDTGQVGTLISDDLLLYIGGESLIAGCITLKDNTMFIGNISINNESFKQSKDIIVKNKDNFSITITKEHSSNTPYPEPTFYYYNTSLNDKYSASFKAFETYRCGILLQFSTGEWSEPIHLGDYILNNLYVWDSYPYINVSNISLPINSEDKQSLIDLGVKKIRSCIVLPNVYERDVVCLGILCPTVFNVGDRKNNTPYALSSWFFRPAMKEGLEEDVYKGANILFAHNKALYAADNRGAEVLNMLRGGNSLSDILTDDLSNTYRAHFLVDENIVTFHSPDVEFDNSLEELCYSDTKLRIIGVAKLGAVSGDISITAGPAATDTIGFNRKYIGYLTDSSVKSNGGLVSGLFYEDALLKTGTYETYGLVSYLIYPWHRSGSLNNDHVRELDKGSRTSVLETKVVSNLKFFNDNVSLSKPINYDISTPKIFNSPEMLLLRIASKNDQYNYYGNVDTVVLSGINSNSYSIYTGTSFDGELTPVYIKDTRTEYISDSKETVRMKYKSSPHLVFSLNPMYDNMHLLPRLQGIDNFNNTLYIIPSWYPNLKDVDSNNPIVSAGAMSIFSSGWLDNYAFSNKVGSYGIGNYNSTTNTGYLALIVQTSGGAEFRPVIFRDGQTTFIVSMSPSYTMRAESDNIFLGTTEEEYDKYLYIGETKFYKCTFTKPGETNDITIEAYTPEPVDPEGEKGLLKLESFTTKLDIGDSPYLLIGELYRDNVINKFGGDTEEAIRSNIWIPSGDPIDIRNIDNTIQIPFLYGDTWYHRYDCLKTAPYTISDKNQIVEIGSFLLETRINLDGRYDKRRGQLSNIDITLENFNKINPVYSLKNNVFTYKFLDPDFYKQSTFGTLVLWSLEKNPGSDIDNWANITFGSYLTMDGNYGKIVDIVNYNNTLLTFQDDCICVINFNEKTLIPVTNGVPIEISNNYKVTGYLLLQSNLGCIDPYSIINTSGGVFFIDSKKFALWKFDGKLNNISDNLFTKEYLKQLKLSNLWSPKISSDNGCRLCYDSINEDIYLIPGPKQDNDKEALCYSNYILQFTSLMSYQGALSLFDFNNRVFTFKYEGDKIKMWENFKGDYNTIFGLYCPFSISFISNRESQFSKIFDTIEYKLDIYDDNGNISNNTFNYIKVENEYLDTTIRRITDDYNKWNPKKKFRIWRGQIPRDLNTLLGKRNARICNPWVKITLGCDDGNTKKSVFHGITVRYTK